MNPQARGGRIATGLQRPGPGRAAQRVEGKRQNTVIHTYPNVSQFWPYRPEDSLKSPVYDRDKFPGCRFCE